MDKITRSKLNYFIIPGLKIEKISEFDMVDKVIRAAILEVMEYTISPKDKSRIRQKVIARNMYCLFMREFCATATLSSVGKSIGRDHTSVMHSLSQVNNLIYTKNLEICYWHKLLNHAIRRDLYVLI
jgi:chromosomal replication initiation ATPase DnaA